MSHATTKAAKLTGRGVRRVFAIDILRKRIVEWSRDLETWSVLDVHGHIEDPVLAKPLSVNALLNAADTDDEVTRHRADLVEWMLRIATCTSVDDLLGSD